MTKKHEAPKTVYLVRKNIAVVGAFAKQFDAVRHCTFLNDREADGQKTWTVEEVAVTY